MLIGYTVLMDRVALIVTLLFGVPACVVVAWATGAWLMTAIVAAVLLPIMYGAATLAFALSHLLFEIVGGAIDRHRNAP
jgi:hypothetical protein